MREGNPVQADTLRGAGTYGRVTRYEGHICGNCRWEDRGREDCPNNKPKRAGGEDEAV